MSSARPGKPLFELLDRARPSGIVRGVVERPEREALSDPRHSDRHPAERATITLSASAAYLGIAGGLGVLVLVWALAYRAGRAAAEGDLARQLRDVDSPELAIRDPLVSIPNDPKAGVADAGDGGLPRSVLPPAARTVSSPPAGTPGARTASAVPPAAGQPGPPNAGEVLVLGNRLGPDPRQDGYNYLELATLDREQASSAIDFLAAQNLRTIGIPKGRDRFRLLCVQLPVPGEEYRAMADDRRRLQQAVAAAGARWRRDQRGGSDFSQTFWVKHAPKEP